MLCGDLKLCSALLTLTCYFWVFYYSFEEICDEIRKLDCELGIIDILKSVNAIDIQNNTEAALFTYLRY